MPVEVILPVMGETMDEATIVKWLVEAGQAVRKGEPLFQIETDKAVLEVDAPATGVLAEVFYGAGSKVPVLTVVGVIAAPDEEAVVSRGPALTQRSAQTATVADGDRRRDDGSALGPQRILASPRARRLAEMEQVDLRDVSGTGPGGRIVERDVQAYLLARSAAAMAPPPTPVARKIAAESGLDLRDLVGTGPGQRVTRADVEAALGHVEARETPKAGRPDVSEKIPLAGIRRIIAERMSASAHTTARVTLTTDTDATEFAALRAQLKASLEPMLGFGISYTDILVAIVARALREHPYMNARLASEEIHRVSVINIGVAVDTERGLLVPVIRDADRKGIADLSRNLHELAERARAGKSLPDDLAGGTFTITNLGMYEIDAFTPIINLPECAILGVGRLREAPAVHQGQLCVRKMMALSLTFDHRLVDGAPAARFLQRIKAFVEQPYLLLT